MDATGNLLRNVLKYRPFLIKPNNKELGGIFGKELKTVEELAAHARILQQEGARNVLVLSLIHILNCLRTGNMCPLRPLSAT